jgi:hypothetical protein
LSPNNFLSPSNISAAKGGNNGNHNNNGNNNPLASAVDSGPGSISSLLLRQRAYQENI